MTLNLRYVGVSCRLGGRRAEVAALEDLTLDCAAGGLTCLIGPNGAGKSTALALAAGLLPATAGEIRLGNRVVSPLSPPPRLGYLPQESAFPRRLTVGEVLEFTAAARCTDDAMGREAARSRGFETLMDQTIGTLSSGWLRRLGLAVALMPPADLLLLDEPFVGLDMETLDSLVLDLVERASEGATVVLCSHDFEVVDRLDASVAVLDEGRLLPVENAAGIGSRALYRRAMAGPVGPRRDGGGEQRSALHVISR